MFLKTHCLLREFVTELPQMHLLSKRRQVKYIQVRIVLVLTPNSVVMYLFRTMY